jgi:trimethylamine---corrinoid protein Co-methyltransferase
MKTQGESHRGPGFTMLGDEQIEEVHLASLEVLRTTGVDVLHTDARQMLKKAGCPVDGNRVRYPSSLVEESIASAPPNITMYGRDGKERMRLEGSRVHFGMGSDTVYVSDPKSRSLKKSMEEDVARAALVADSLEHIDYVMSLGLVHDAPEGKNDLVQFQKMAENTVKPICFTAHNKTNLQKIIDMASVAADGLENLQKYPYIIHYSEPNSPLMLTSDAIEKLLLCSELSIPLLFTPGSMSAGTAPTTRAGALVLSNAEALSGLVLHQLKNPGAPIISGGNSMVMDLSTSICSYGAPEFHMVIAAYAQLYHRYQIPVWGFAGCSDSHLPDEQAAIEATYSIMMNAMAGVNLVHDVGYLSSGLTGSCEMLVLSDEIIGMVKRMLRGIEVNKETLALDAIDRVGPGGHFLTDDHTLKHMRTEFWRPGLLNRENLENWQKLGSLSLRERLNRKVLKILKEHNPVLLAQTVREKIELIIKSK